MEKKRDHEQRQQPPDWRRPEERDASMQRLLGIGIMVAVLVANLATPPGREAYAHPNLARASATQLTSGAAIDAYLERAGFQGYMLLIRHGRVILSKGYGMADREHQVLNTRNTPWPMFGAQGLMIAVALLKLQEEGRLRVQDRICTYLRPCPDSWRPITIHHLLTGTSGIGTEADALPGGMANAVATCKTLPLAGPAGTLLWDGPCNRVLLSTIVEKAAGRPFAAYLREKVLSPAGMTKSSITTSAGAPSGGAKGYVNGSAAPPLATPGYPRVFSSVADLQRLDQALLAGKIISRQSLRLLFTPYINDNPPYDGPYRGYGNTFVVAATKTSSAYAFQSGGPDGSGFMIDNFLSPTDGTLHIELVNDPGRFDNDADNSLSDYLVQLLWGK